MSDKKEFYKDIVSLTRKSKWANDSELMSLCDKLEQSLEASDYTKLGMALLKRSPELKKEMYRFMFHGVVDKNLDDLIAGVPLVISTRNVQVKIES